MNAQSVERKYQSRKRPSATIGFKKTKCEEFVINDNLDKVGRNGKFPNLSDFFIFSNKLEIIGI